MIRAALFVLAICATPASAHGTLPGGGGFYSGFAHPFLAIDQFLLTFALGMTIGNAHRTVVPQAALCLMAAALAGMWLASAGIFLPAAGYVVLAVSAVLGIGLAATIRVPGSVATATAIATGLLAGIGTDVPPATGGAVPAFAAYLAQAGVVSALFLIAMNAAALSAAMTHPVLAVARRIIGSWVAAIAVMVLALQLTG